MPGNAGGSPAEASQGALTRVVITTLNFTKLWAAVAASADEPPALRIDYHLDTMTRDQLLQLIDQGKAPGVILIGGDNEFLTGQAFTEVRDRIVAREPGIAIESFSETSDLGTIVDAYRTMSLFGNRRLLIVPEVNA